MKQVMKSLNHNGIYVPSYDYKGFSITIQGHSVKLKPKSEQMKKTEKDMKKEHKNLERFLGGGGI